MANRKLTIVCEIRQPDANWIWDSHKLGHFIWGIQVESIAEGDLVGKLEKELEKELEEKKLTVEQKSPTLRT